MVERSDELARRVLTRDELTTPFLHPYRHWLPRAWAMTGARKLLAMSSAGLVALVVLGVATGASSLAWLGAIAVASALALVGWWTAEAALIVARRSRAWNQPSELGTVRMRRPHADQADISVAHDEFAVTAEDTGELFVWRFRPLPIDELGSAGEVLVPGIPEYTAVVVETLPFAADDAGRAAEQLADAQAHAADLEAGAIAAALRRLAAQSERREVEAETRSTADALKHVTGQRRTR